MPRPYGPPLEKAKVPYGPTNIFRQNLNDEVGKNSTKDFLVGLTANIYLK